MKTIIETQTGLCFDLDELAAVEFNEPDLPPYIVYIFLKGNNCCLRAGEFDDLKSAQEYRDKLIKEWIGDEED